ncbi:MAG: RNA polymerase sigma factor [Planctomycetota bacterium]|jgi:RNA polymerase sigma factor (sigma-70 family)
MAQQRSEDRIRRENRERLARLLATRSFRDRVEGYLHTRIGNLKEQEIAEGYKHALSNVPRKKRLSYPLTWTGKVVLRRIVHQRKKQPHLVSLDGENVPPVLCSDPAPEEVVEIREWIQLLEAVVERLSPGNQQVLTLWQQGKTHRQIAEVLGITVEATRVRLHRAIAGLRRQLAKMLSDSSKKKT